MSARVIDATPFVQHAASTWRLECVLPGDARIGLAVIDMPPRLTVVPKAAAPEQEVADELADGATHHQIAQRLLTSLAVKSGAQPVASDGALWTPNETGLWVGQSVDQLAVLIGKTFSAQKRCARGSDYRQVATHIMGLADNPDFFADATPAVVCPSGVWTLDEGTLKHAPLTHEHRQRFAIEVDPDFDGEAVLFKRCYLADTFEGNHPEEQSSLAAELVGAALFGLAARFMTVALLKGPGASGKSTFLQIVQKLFPAHYVASVSPFNWGQEYYLGGLAGKRLNLVGEMPANTPLPDAHFKNVTGFDLLGARHPTHRPFYFRCEAAHLFSSNTLPSTLDRSEAFFRRWRILSFLNPVAHDRRDPDLVQKIVALELGAVLAWAMRGAERAAKRGRLRTTPAHDALMQRWRVGANPFLLFATDPEYCLVDPSARERSSAVYQRYRDWSFANGNKPMSVQKFTDMVDDTGGTLGICRGRDDERHTVGLRLVPPHGGLLS